MSGRDRHSRADSVGRRPGRNTTHATEAYREEDALEPPSAEAAPVTGAAAVDPSIAGYQAPTAMFDKGQFLGELAELVGVPDTKAQVDATPTAPRGCRLIAVAGPELGIEWAFKNPEVVLGRDEDCDLPMPDIAVSRRHARISLRESAFELEDLGSGNGTFLNGERVERAVLSPGDEIIVGERTFRFLELSEAPPTAAAHPLPKPLPSEPSVGELGSAAASSAIPLGRRSQIDVGVVSQASEPAANLEVAPAKAAPTKPRGTLRSVVTAIGAAALVGATIFVGVALFARWAREESPADRRTRARREFLQSIELVKAKRFGDAVLLLDRVLAIEPEHARAKEYRAHASGELAQWKALEAARALAAEHRYTEALDALHKVPGESAYFSDAAELRRGIQRSIADALVTEARTKAAAKDVEGARQLLDLAIERSPEHTEARRLKAEFEAQFASTKVEPARPSRPRVSMPPELARAVALYEAGQLPAAVDAAEAAGGPEGKASAVRIGRVKALLQEAAAAYEKKAAGELLRIVPAALELDQQLASGRGTVKRRLESYYADALYLKGVEACADEDDVRCFKLLSQALTVSRKHKLAETRLAELMGKARDIYYEGYALKDQDPEKTRKIFKRLMQMTRPDNPYHKLSAKWLASNGK